jgi:SAM-dependent methyltransferase
MSIGRPMGTEDERDGSRPAPVPSRRADEFDALYTSTPPWDIGRPQPAFLRLAGTGQLRGRILDVGCGTGEHALMAAALGLETVGVDAAPTAIAIAKRKAEERRLPVRFLVADALDLPTLAATFDTVIDCGLFHIFDDDERARYVDSLRAVISIGGRYHMLCFSDRQPGDWGPRRIRSEEIVASFADGWRIDSIEPSVLDVTIDQNGVSAWLAAISRG